MEGHVRSILLDLPAHSGQVHVAGNRNEIAGFVRLAAALPVVEGLAIGHLSSRGHHDLCASVQGVSGVVFGCARDTRIGHPKGVGLPQGIQIDVLIDHIGNLDGRIAVAILYVPAQEFGIASPWEQGFQLRISHGRTLDDGQLPAIRGGDAGIDVDCLVVGLPLGVDRDAADGRGAAQGGGRVPGQLLVQAPVIELSAVLGGNVVANGFLILLGYRVLIGTVDINDVIAVAGVEELSAIVATPRTLFLVVEIKSGNRVIVAPIRCGKVRPVLMVPFIRSTILVRCTLGRNCCTGHGFHIVIPYRVAAILTIEFLSTQGHLIQCSLHGVLVFIDTPCSARPFAANIRSMLGLDGILGLLLPFTPTLLVELDLILQPVIVHVDDGGPIAGDDPGVGLTDLEALGGAAGTDNRLSPRGTRHGLGLHVRILLFIPVGCVQIGVLPVGVFLPVDHSIVYLIAGPAGIQGGAFGHGIGEADLLATLDRREPTGEGITLTVGVSGCGHLAVLGLPGLHIGTFLTVEGHPHAFLGHGVEGDVPSNIHGQRHGIRAALVRSPAHQALTGGKLELTVGGIHLAVSQLAALHHIGHIHHAAAIIKGDIPDVDVLGGDRNGSVGRDILRNDQLAARDVLLQAVPLLKNLMVLGGHSGDLHSVAALQLLGADHSIAILELQGDDDGLFGQDVQQGDLPGPLFCDRLIGGQSLTGLRIVHEIQGQSVVSFHHGVAGRHHSCVLGFKLFLSHIGFPAGSGQESSVGSFHACHRVQQRLDLGRGFCLYLNGGILLNRGILRNLQLRRQRRGGQKAHAHRQDKEQGESAFAQGL